MRARGTHRVAQVAEVVRHVVAEALATDIRDPRVGLVTVTGTRVSRDLGHAYVSVVVHAAADDPEATERALVGLASASGYVRRRVARALETRTVPELHFVADTGEEHRARIEAVLAELRREEEEGGEGL